MSLGDEPKSKREKLSSHQSLLKNEEEMKRLTKSRQEHITKYYEQYTPLLTALTDMPKELLELTASYDPNCDKKCLSMSKTPFVMYEDCNCISDILKWLDLSFGNLKFKHYKKNWFSISSQPFMYNILFFSKLLPDFEIQLRSNFLRQVIYFDVNNTELFKIDKSYYWTFLDLLFSSIFTEEKIHNYALELQKNSLIPLTDKINFLMTHLTGFELSYNVSGLNNNDRFDKVNFGHDFLNSLFSYADYTITTTDNSIWDVKFKLNFDELFLASDVKFKNIQMPNAQPITFISRNYTNVVNAIQTEINTTAVIIPPKSGGFKYKKLNINF